VNFSAKGKSAREENGDCYQFPPLELDICTRFAPKLDLAVNSGVLATPPPAGRVTAGEAWKLSEHRGSASI
jgi:hypothetical protein